MSGKEKWNGGAGGVFSGVSIKDNSHFGLGGDE